MKAEIKRDVRVVLELTQEELNTIVCAYGASNQNRREEISINDELEILKDTESTKFYEDLVNIARNI